MDINDFWTIIEDVKSKSNDIDLRMKSLEEKLISLASEEVLSFGNHFNELLDRAYNWDLWAAAYIIMGGCSDDAFWDFRSSLISTGKELFEKALSSPDNLASFPDYEIDNLHAEGFQYVHCEVYEKKEGSYPPRYEKHLEAPSGVQWKEDDIEYLKSNFPLLFDRYWE